MPSPASSSPSQLPPQAPSVTTRRRRRRKLLPPSSSATTPTSASATSSSSSSRRSSSSSGLSFSPSPSPFHHRFLSPLRASAVPFSWEHRPGIPKTPARQQGRSGGKAAPLPLPLPLPLPPSLLAGKVSASAYPNTAADYFIVPPDDAKAARWRRRSGRQQLQRQRRSPALAATLTDWLAVLSLYRSCTRSRDCLAGTPPPAPRCRPPSEERSRR